MQNSGRFRRSRSFTSVRFHPSVIAPDIATVTSRPSRRWRRLVTLGIVSLVFLAGCGGGSKSLGNQPPPPTPTTPTITTISPNSAVAGGAAFTLTINGTNFVASSMVNFGGAAPTATFVNSTQLTAAIPASSIASTGMLAVKVTNPASGGGTSNPINFTITSGGPSPAPTINSLIPSCVPAGEQFINAVNNQLTVTGLNFVASSVVRWNGTDRPTTLENSLGKILSAQISASDIAAAGTATVTVFNPAPGGGTSNSLIFTTATGGADPRSIAVDPAGKFAYVANWSCSSVSGYVSMYTINPTTGALASIGPPVSSQDISADSVTVDPSGKFAYVTSLGDDFSSDGSVAMYTINATTGALTPVGAISGNCPGLCVPLSVAVDPSGKFAYVPNGGLPNSVAMYTINATTGALTSIGKTAVEGFAASVAVDPSGKFAYVMASGPGSAGSVSTYTINATTGALTSIGTIAAGKNPVSMVVDPTSKFAYVANSSSNDVSMYAINVTTGALTSMGAIAAGTNPDSIVVNPTGKFVYVANFNSNDVSMYTINVNTGALTSIGTIAAGQFPTSIAAHPSGKFAYVTNSMSNDVSIYSIDGATGALTLIGTTGI
jgi:DNA-binding beta-propeller fold protein YncE